MGLKLRNLGLYQVTVLGEYIAEREVERARANGLGRELKKAEKDKSIDREVHRKSQKKRGRVGA